MTIDIFTPKPSAEILRARRHVWRMGSLPGGYRSDIVLAQRLIETGLAKDTLIVWERIRYGRARSAAADIITALKWIISHPGQTPSPALIWPDLFSNR